jgi:hypothetical protein
MQPVAHRHSSPCFCGVVIAGFEESMRTSVRAHCLSCGCKLDCDGNLNTTCDAQWAASAPSPQSLRPLFCVPGSGAVLSSFDLTFKPGVGPRRTPPGLEDPARAPSASYGTTSNRLTRWTPATTTKDTPTDSGMQRTDFFPIHCYLPRLISGEAPEGASALSRKMMRAFTPIDCALAPPKWKYLSVPMRASRATVCYRQHSQGLFKFVAIELPQLSCDQRNRSTDLNGICVSSTTAQRLIVLGPDHRWSEHGFRNVERRASTAPGMRLSPPLGRSLKSSR